MSAASEDFSALSQPAFGSVLSRCNFLRLIVNCVWQNPRLATIGQLFGKSFRQIIPEIDTLYAALLQQSAARTALSCARNLAAINHHIRMYGLCETGGRVRVGGYSSQFRAFTIYSQCIAQGAMNFFIDQQ